MQARLVDAMPDILAAVREGKGVIIRCPAGGDVIFARRAAELVREQIITTHQEDDARRTRLVRAAAVGGSVQKAAFQEHVMREFNKGEVDVLTYVNLINMGADLPPGKLFVNLAPTGSRVVMVQGIGRVLRLQVGQHGKPVEARVIDYEDPTALPGTQYTVLDALNLKAGHTAKIGFVGQIEAKYSQAAEPYALLGIPAEVVAAIEVGSILLGHNDDVVLETHTLEPEQIERSLEKATELLDFPAICRWFGTGEQMMKRYLDQAGFNTGDMLSHDDLSLLAMEYESLNIEVLPDEGYISVDEVAERFGYKGTPIQFVIEHRKLGFDITRFRNEGERAVRHYMRLQDVKLPKRRIN